MKHSSYNLPNFINVIYRKVENNLRAETIDLARFNQYCLAVLLYYLKHYRDSIVGLPFSQNDDATFQHLCKACHFRVADDGEGLERKLLVGLSPELFGDAGLVSRIQLLVNHFAQYEVLKDHSHNSDLLRGEYDTACIHLESLRKEFRLSARFKYNKSKRKDNPFFKGGVEVNIPEEMIMPPSEVAGTEAAETQS
ncbi:MAG: hypothetical protein JNL40_07405 [Cyclobacteriaceae bacterium]|nr:hypothetical protein [Cyclobacteriaceae bacterium]